MVPPHTLLHSIPCTVLLILTYIFCGVWFLRRRVRGRVRNKLLQAPGDCWLHLYEVTSAPGVNRQLFGDVRHHYLQLLTGQLHRMALISGWDISLEQLDQVVEHELRSIFVVCKTSPSGVLHLSPLWTTGLDRPVFLHARPVCSEPTPFPGHVFSLLELFEAIAPDVVVGSIDPFLGTPIVTTALGPALREWLGQEKQRTSIRHAVPPHKEQYLTAVGLRCNPEGEPHAHGVSKSLEEAALADCMRVVGDHPFAAISTKSARVLAKAASVQNVCLTGRDWGRYDHVRHDPPRFEESVAVMHDVLHHLTAADVSNMFTDNPNLRQLVATAVIPPELLDGELPCWPAVYTFDVVDDMLYFYPDGHVAGHYVQPASCVQWLGTSTIVSPAGTITVSLISSRYAHHVFLFSLGDYLPEPSRVFDLGPYTVLPRWLAPHMMFNTSRVHTKLLSKMVMFSYRYDSGDPDDYYAKTAQLQTTSMDSHSLSEMVSVAQAAYLLRASVGGKRTSVRTGLLSIVMWILYIITNPLGVVGLLFRGMPVDERSGNRARVVRTYPRHAAVEFPTIWTRGLHYPPVDWYSVLHEPTLLSIFAYCNVALTGWVVPKILVTEFLSVLVRFSTVHQLVDFAHHLWHYSQLTGERGLLLVFVAWLTLTGYLSLPFSPLTVLRSQIRFAAHLLCSAFGYPWVASLTLGHVIACVYGVGGYHLVQTPGYSWFWQLFVTWVAGYAAFPGYFPWHAHPWQAWRLLVCVPSGGFLASEDWGAHSRAGHSGALHDAATACFWMAVVVLVLLYSCARPVLTGFLQVLTPTSRTLGRGVHSERIPVSRDRVLPEQVVQAPVQPMAAPPIVRPVPPVNDQPLPAIPDYRPILAHHWGVNDQPAPRNTGFHPGANLHPYRQWFRLWTHDIFEDFLRSSRAMPRLGRPLRDGYTCFWTALSTLSGVPTDVLLCSYLATLCSDDIQNYHHHGLVNRNDMARVAALFGFGLTTLIDRPGGEGAAAPLALTAPRPGFPTLNLRLAQVFDRDQVGVAWHATIVGQEAFPVPPPPAFVEVLVGGQNVALPPPVLAEVPVAAEPAALVLPQVEGLEVPGPDVADDVLRLGFVQQLAENFREEPIFPQAVADMFDGWVADDGVELVGLSTKTLPFSKYAHAIRAVPVDFAQTYEWLSRRLAPTAVTQHASRVLGVPPPQNPLGDFVMPAAVPLVAMEHSFDPHRPTAELLAQDLRENKMLWCGPSSPPTLPAAQKENCKHAEQRQIRIVSLFGVPGCGKTTEAKARITRLGLDVAAFTWAFPSPLVEGDSLSKTAEANPLGPTAYSSQYCSAYELFRKNVDSHLVLDDFTRWPAGTLDWLVYNNPALEEVWLTGDPAQTQVSFPDPTAVSRVLGGIADNWLERGTNRADIRYATISHRLAPNVARCLGMHSSRVGGAELGSLIFVGTPPPCLPLLATSPRFVETKSSGGTAAFVITGSQGLDIDGDYVFDLGGMTDSVTDSVAWVALTRGRGNVFLSWDLSNSRPRAPWGCSRILSALVATSASSCTALLTREADPLDLVPHHVWSHIRAAVPAVSPLEPPLDLIGLTDDDPQLLVAMQHPHYRPLARANETSNPAPPLTVPQHTPDKIHAPVFADYGDGPSRELFVAHHGRSQVFPERKHPAAAHQSRNDTALEAASIAKRQGLASAADNRKAIANPGHRFAQLRDGFLAQFPGFRHVRDFGALLDECADRCLDSWLASRTLKQIVLSLTGEDPDWDVKRTRVFLKAQVVRKSEKWGLEAKPGQIVTTFPAVKTFRDATYALALETVILRDCPAHVLLYLRRTPDDLVDWVATHMSGQTVYTENDYTAWDSGVDGPFVRFLAWLMEQLSFPASYIAEWKEEKAATRFFGGNLQLMQHSGDRYTYLANTVCNLALSNAVYGGLGRVGQVYGGDDSLIAGSHRVAPGFRPSEWRMAPKTIVGAVGHIFGFQVRAGSISYDWQYMRNRLELAIIERQDDADFFTSFADQLARFADPTDEMYAMVFHMLVSHVRQRRLTVPLVNAVVADFEAVPVDHTRVFTGGLGDNTNAGLDTPFNFCASLISTLTPTSTAASQTCPQLSKSPPPVSSSQSPNPPPTPRSASQPTATSPCRSSSDSLWPRPRNSSTSAPKQRSSNATPTTSSANSSLSSLRSRSVQEPPALHSGHTPQPTPPPLTSRQSPTPVKSMATRTVPSRKSGSWIQVTGSAGSSRGSTSATPARSSTSTIQVGQRQRPLLTSGSRYGSLSPDVALASSRPTR